MRGGCKYHRTWPDMGALWPEWVKESDHFHRTLSPRLLSYHTELTTSDSYGRISDASIKLRGYTRSVLVWPDHPRSSGLRGVFLDRQHGQSRSDMDCVWMFEHPHEPPHWEYFGKGTTPSSIDRDEASQFVAFPVGMASPDDDEPVMVSILILDPIEGLRNTYRRVGLGQMHVSSEMEKSRWEEQDLTLI